MHIPAARCKDNKKIGEEKQNKHSNNTDTTGSKPKGAEDSQNMGRIHDRGKTSKKCNRSEDYAREGEECKGAAEDYNGKCTSCVRNVESYFSTKKMGANVKQRSNSTSGAVSKDKADTSCRS